MQVISPDEAARRLKKHRSTIYRMIERGEVSTKPILEEKVGVLWDETTGELVKASRLRTK